MSDAEVDELVEQALEQMTLKEKIDQMAGRGIIKSVLMDLKFGDRAYPGGGLERLGIPPYSFTDGPRGCIITGSTCFPVSMARGASWDIELEEKVGEIIGKEVRAHGGNLFGGVCVNLLRHPAGGRAQETYGEDPFHIGEFGAALVRGVQKHNVMATVKHFALNNQEKTRFKINVETDERTLREVYLPHFKRCIQQGCATVMSAYNKFRGEHCGHNAYLLRTILKEEWGFKGFVHSDWIYGLKDTIGGITGGLDSEMPRAKYYGKKLRKAVESGIVEEDLINDAVRRILRTVLRFTSREEPQIYDKSLIACEEHVKIAREAAEKSMVLLKNDGNLLPFSTEKVKSLAVIGPIADLKNTGDHGSSSVRQRNIVTPLQGIKNQVGEKVSIVFNDGSDLDSARNIAMSADAVVLVVGYTHKDEGEYIPFLKAGGDRTNLGLHSEDIELIQEISKVNSDCVVTLIGGSAILMEEWKDMVPSILMAFYSGMQGGNALANILFGKVNPSGKLPFTIPKNETGLPEFDIDAEEIEYDYYHGYTLMDKNNIEPAFPFGFGLSYTNFTYDNLSVKLDGDMLIVNVSVSNTGERSGDEIVQLYVGFENSKIERPKKVLKGFSRISLDPNETKNVLLKINTSDLSWYNPESKIWELEEMIYTVHVGPSSKNEDLLKKEIAIK